MWSSCKLVKTKIHKYKLRCIRKKIRWKCLQVWISNLNVVQISVFAEFTGRQGLYWAPFDPKSSQVRKKLRETLRHVLDLSLHLITFKVDQSRIQVWINRAFWWSYVIASDFFHIFSIPSDIQNWNPAVVSEAEDFIVPAVLIGTSYFHAAHFERDERKEENWNFHFLEVHSRSDCEKRFGCEFKAKNRDKLSFGAN